MRALILLLLMGSLVANLPEELGHLHHNAASLDKLKGKYIAMPNGVEYVKDIFVFDIPPQYSDSSAVQYFPSVFNSEEFGIKTDLRQQ